MPTTLGGMKIVTLDSGHQAIHPPATSLFPPTPPGVPVPTPVPYLVKSSTGSGSGVKSCLKVSSSKVIVKDCEFSVEQPANTTSQPNGADVVSHAQVGKAAADEGDDRVQIDSAPICVTGKMVRANMIAGASKVSQVKGPWVEGGGTGSAGSEDKDGSAKGGSASDPADALQLSDPVAVATGEVVDRGVDLFLPGAIELAFERHYVSSNAKRRSALGKGGWSHSLEQQVTPHESRPDEVLTLFDGDARRIHFDHVEQNGSTFHRRERLVLTRTAKNTYSIRRLDDRLTRTFAPIDGTGPARLTAIRDPNGHTIALHYEHDRLARVVDTAGRELRFGYAKKYLARVELWARGKLERWVDYIYTAAGELAEVRNALGHAEAYAYDEHQRMVHKTLTHGLSFRYTYAPDTGRCVKVEGDGGLQAVELTFDLEDKTTLASGEEPRKYTWDDDGFILKEESFDGSYVEETDYDDDHYPVAQRNAAGEEVLFEYDEHGNRTKAVDPAGNETLWHYASDLLVKRVDANGLETHLSYDRNGNLESVRYPTGLVRILTYDRHARLAAIHDDGHLAAAYEYDDEHNLVREKNARGGVTEREYDALGRTIVSRSPIGATVKVGYDAISRPVTVERADGVVLTFGYDRRGNVISRDDSTGRRVRMKYAGTGVLVRYELANGQAYDLEYDALERLRLIKNPRMETYELRYDRMGRLVEEKTFDERTLRYVFNKAGRLARILYPDGGFRALAYDVLGNIVEDRAPDSLVTFERGPLGLLDKATLEDDAGSVVLEFERDELGRVVKERQNGHEIAFRYDARGRRAARVLPGGHTTEYTWDDAGDVTGIVHAGHAAAIQRDVAGRMTRLHVYAGRIDMQWTYDTSHRVVGELVTSAVPDPAAGAPTPGGYRTLVERRYGYDGFGRLAAVEDGRWGRSRFVHDLVGQLVEADLGRHRATYEYDSTGSLVRVAGDAAPQEAFTLRTGNVLMNAGGERFEYDARHRRRRDRAEAEGVAGEERITRYRWDGRDRLREVWFADGSRAYYTYDALGRRVKKTLVAAPSAFAPSDEEIERMAEEGEAPTGPPTRTVDFLWDDSTIAAELDSTLGERVFVHFPGSFAPLFQAERGEVFTCVTDPVGTPRELVDADGTLAWAGLYSPWGEELEHFDARSTGLGSGGPASPVATPFRLLGQYHDQETGLCATKHRMFDASVARWLSPDPLGFAGGANLFGWSGSPLDSVDPLGLNCYLLNDGTAATFKNGSYTARVLTQDELLWRAGQKGTADGQFYDAAEPTSVSGARNDKAILPEWPGGGKSPIDHAYQARVPAGTVVYEGTVAPQTGTDGTVYPGGTNQTVLPWAVTRPPAGSGPRFPVTGDKSLPP